MADEFIKGVKGILSFVGCASLLIVFGLVWQAGLGKAVAMVLVYVLPPVAVSFVAFACLLALADKVFPDSNLQKPAIVATAIVVFIPLVTLPLTTNKSLLEWGFSGVFNLFDSGEWVDEVPVKVLGQWTEVNDDVREGFGEAATIVVTSGMVTVTYPDRMREPIVLQRPVFAVKVDDRHIVLHCEDGSRGETYYHFRLDESGRSAWLEREVPGTDATDYQSGFIDMGRYSRTVNPGGN